MCACGGGGGGVAQGGDWMWQANQAVRGLARSLRLQLLDWDEMAWREWDQLSWAGQMETGQDQLFRDKVHPKAAVTAAFGTFVLGGGV